MRETLRGLPPDPRSTHGVLPAMPDEGQRLLEEYGRGGGLERQAAVARELYRRRCELMLAALDAHMPAEVTWTRPKGGFFTWLTYPPGVDTVAMAGPAMEQRVAFVPGGPFFPDGSGANTLRLSFSRVDDGDIGEGVRRLAGVSRGAVQG